MKEKPPNYIIGIGASAGGFKALSNLIAELPPSTGASFVIVQHLSSDDETIMDKSLAKHTCMPVHFAINDDWILPDHVYLIPHNKNMIITDGKLMLSDIPPNSGSYLPIDLFFRSLSKEQGPHSVVMLLSGTGADGSRGIRDIKEADGIVLVQGPLEPLFDDMSNSAINTGLADIVIPVNQIVSKLISYITHPLTGQNNTAWRAHLASSEGTIKNIFALLHKESGIDFAEYKPSTVARRIERRLGLSGAESIDNYYTLLQKNPAEARILRKELLIGVTRFFRDENAFELLRKKVIPSILDNKKATDPLRVWTTGVSTGEEAYSIAMLIHEAMNERDQYRELKIFATDVDPEAINFASAAIYPATIAMELSAVRLEQFFQQNENEYSVVSYLRRSIVFSVHNLISDPPFSNVDLVICRNMLIYFQHSAQNKSLSFLHFALEPRGYLFLGSAESLGEFQPYFDCVDQQAKIFQKNHNVRLTIEPEKGRHGIKTLPRIPNVPLVRHHRVLETRNALTEVSQVLIDAYSPPCIVLNEKFEAIHTYGNANDYFKNIQPGRISNSIYDLIEDKLFIVITTAIRKVLAEKKEIIYHDVRFKTDTFDRLINVHAKYINNSRMQENLILLVFEEQKIKSQDMPDDFEVFSESEHAQQRIRDLEFELHQNMGTQQITVEELETSNEELQGTNEELMSGNEEMQSTNEELQSVNEELHTVNSEYQQKIHDLTQAYIDLDNLLRSQEIATLFLDKQMLIRRFTSAIVKYINLIPLDQDRPFSHISHVLKIDNLLEEISTVLDGNNSFRKKLTTVEGGSVLLRITPYINEKGKKDGVVLTIFNLDEIKNLYGSQVMENESAAMDPR